jgi:hypothetical protein
VTFLSERLAMPNLKVPTSLDRRLLAYLHSGEVVRHFLPKFLRISAIMGFVGYAILWLRIWSAVYREFERWGLVKAFFAQIIALATIFLLMRITQLRARHLEALPVDDFVVLRAVAVLCRWFAETTMVYVLGMELTSLLQPLSPFLMSFLNAQPNVTGGAGGALLSLASGALSALAVLVIAPLFLVLYSTATAIDLSLAIEFNTRAERVGTELL